MIYVSPAQKVKGRDGFWVALVSDESLDELHLFAKLIDAPLEAFVASPTLPRYELRLSYRHAALGAGADPLSASEILQRCKGKITPPNPSVSQINPTPKPKAPKKPTAAKKPAPKKKTPTKKAT